MQSRLSPAQNLLHSQGGHLGLEFTESDALAAAMQEAPRAHDGGLPIACPAMTACSSQCCLSCVSLRSHRWLRARPGNLTVLARESEECACVYMAVSAECYDWCQRQPGSWGSCNSCSADCLYMSCRSGQLPPSLMSLAKPQHWYSSSKSRGTTLSH